MNKPNHNVYGVISEILGISARYSSDTLRRAERHAQRAYHGVDGEVIVTIIGQLLRLSEPTVEPAAVSAEDGARPVVDPIAREIRAILSDTSFLPSKSDLVELGKRYLAPRADLHADAKDSRRRILERFLFRFNQLPEGRQKAIYQSLRRTYLRDRQSSLSEWTEAFSKSTAER